MKNSSNKFRGKNNKESKKNSDFGYYSKNTNRSDKSDRFLKSSAKNMKVENFKKNDENNTFSTLKRRNPRFKSNKECPNKNSDVRHDCRPTNRDVGRDRSDTVARNIEFLQIKALREIWHEHKPLTLRIFLPLNLNVL